MTRDQAMNRHPSMLARLAEDARDQQAMDLGNRALADSELHVGGPLRQANEKHHEISTGPRAWMVSALPIAAIVTAIFVLTIWASVASDFARWLAWGF